MAKPALVFAFLQCALLATAFRITCAPFKRERIDPIVGLDSQAPHMHTFWGGYNVHAGLQSSAELREGCTSCNNQHDKSSYWMPTLYYVKQNSTTPVEVSIFHVYYSGGVGRDPLPEDFSILSGDPTLTEEEFVEQGRGGIDWNFETSDEEKPAYRLPAQRGEGWLRANVGFPTLVVKDDEIGRYRECDKSTETCINIPRIFFAVWYELGDAEFYNFEEGDYLTLSSGGGHTYHGDIFNGWDPEVATEVAETWAEWADIGGPDVYDLSDECATLATEYPPLYDLDPEAVAEAKAGNGSVNLGHYGRHLTITDGRSVNATWSGAWGEEASDEPLDDQSGLSGPPASSAASPFSSSSVTSSNSATAVPAQSTSPYGSSSSALVPSISSSVVTEPTAEGTPIVIDISSSTASYGSHPTTATAKTDCSARKPGAKRRRKQRGTRTQ